MASRKQKKAKIEAAAAEALERAQAAETAQAATAPPDPPRSQQTEDRLTDAERRIMERFFGLGPRYPEWPVSAMQRRMQSSRG